MVLDGLAFANGVALAADESYVAVAETGARTVVRWWLTGPKAGTRDLLVGDLPGYPDNIARGATAWSGCRSRAHRPGRRAPPAEPEAGPPGRDADPRAPPAQAKRTVRAQAYDDAGTLVHDLDLPSDGPGGSYHMVTGVREHDGRVWFGSLHEPAIAVVTLR